MKNPLFLMLCSPFKFVLLSLALCSQSPSHAATGVSPIGVMVRNQGPTSVFLTFLGTAGQTSAESFWCTAVQPGIGGGSVVPFNPCLPGTLLGSLPSSLNLSQPSGTSGITNFTDIMTIPSTIARKAYQQGGGFFYVRKFTGAGGSQYVVVTCRLGSGGARSPLAVMGLELFFDGQFQTEPVTYFSNTRDIKPFFAKIRYNGSGRLIGRWEIVQPGDPEPSSFDLLPAGSLPLELRAQQTSYRVLAPFDIFLPPSGSVVIPGPDPSLLNTSVLGDYRILLRLNASSGLDSSSATGAGITQAGGVSGFSFPFLRYNVGSNNKPVDLSSAKPKESLIMESSDSSGSIIATTILQEVKNSAGETSKIYVFSWTPVPEVGLYELLFSFQNGKVYRVLLPSTQVSYDTQPVWLSSIKEPVTWQLKALDANGNMLKHSSPSLIMPNP